MLPRAKRVLLPDVGVRRLPIGVGRGIRMRIDFAHQTRLYLGLYEVELNRWLRAFAHPGYRAFDVGGHVGYDALVLAKLTGAPVVSFEAEPAFYATLAANVELNPPFRPLVRPVLAKAGKRGDVDVLALDDFAFEEGAWVPDLIKIDVEGHEADVLRGANDILDRRQPHVILETHSVALEQMCAHMLVDHGYRPTIVHQRGLWSDLRPTEHNRWIVAAGRV